MRLSVVLVRRPSGGRARPRRARDDHRARRSARREGTRRRVGRRRRPRPLDPGRRERLRGLADEQPLLRDLARRTRAAVLRGRAGHRAGRDAHGRGARGARTSELVARVGERQPVSKPVRLAGSHKRWRGLATAESWNARTRACTRLRTASTGSRSRRHPAGRGTRSARTTASSRPATRSWHGVGELARSRRGLTDGPRRRGRGAEAQSRRCSREDSDRRALGASRFSSSAAAFETRMHPCETAWPSRSGRGVPWMPTTPPPGHSLSFE